jgi:ATP-dependent Clp protease adaptor protein ClpS
MRGGTGKAIILPSCHVAIRHVSRVGAGLYSKQTGQVVMPGKIPDNATEHEQGVAVAPSRPATARPPLYQVVLLNDDYTPMEFVVVVLETFFNMGRERATQVMLHVHTRGKGVCGVFSREVAESKVAQVNEYSRLHQHPLLCTMEKL